MFWSSLGVLDGLEEDTGDGRAANQALLPPSVRGQGMRLER